MSRNACNGEKSPASGDLNWMPKRGPLETGDFGEIGGFGENHQGLAIMAINVPTP